MIHTGLTPLIRYCALFEVNKSKSACKALGADLAGKLQEGQRVCVQCQEAAMRRHLGYRCYGHGAMGKSTRWSTLVNHGCHGRWTRLDDQLAATFCSCGANNVTGSVEPDFIFV